MMTLQLISANAQGEGPSKVAERPSERSYLRLAASIMELIRHGEIKPGERLPAERVLAERFDVSRTAVREATISLEIQGVVEVRGGSGVYVTQTPARNRVVMPFMPASEPGPFELLSARCLIEAEIAGQAAQVRKDSDLDRIFSALTEMRERMDDKEANAEADRLFHVCIAESTGNSVLTQMVVALWAQARGPIWTKIEHHFHTPELRLASLADHQRIFNALLARDAEGSRAAMRAHIERVMAEFAQAWR